MVKKNLLIIILLWLSIPIISWGSDSFYILVVPKHRVADDVVVVELYANYENSTNPVMEGSGSFEIFYPDGRSTGLKENLFFNKKTGHWQAKPVNASTLDHGEYYCRARIEDQNGEKVSRREYFFIIR